LWTHLNLPTFYRDSTQPRVKGPQCRGIIGERRKVDMKAKTAKPAAKKAAGNAPAKKAAASAKKKK
jgi:hypothetical protein